MCYIRLRRAETVGKLVWNVFRHVWNVLELWLKLVFESSHRYTWNILLSESLLKLILKRIETCLKRCETYLSLVSHVLICGWNMFVTLWYSLKLFWTCFETRFETCLKQFEMITEHLFDMCVETVFWDLLILFSTFARNWLRHVWILNWKRSRSYRKLFRDMTSCLPKRIWNQSRHY